jgi:hypothetical protein
MQLSALTKVLGGEKVLRKSVRNRMDLIELSNKESRKMRLYTWRNILLVQSLKWLNSFR